MEFTITNASYRKWEKKRSINSLEELQKVIDELHPGWHNDGKTKDAIINFDEQKITIYDEYIE